MMLPAFPSEPGHSQSMSMPSKMPAPVPSGVPGRLPLMNRSMHDDTKCSRDCFVSAASEKYLENVHPPIEISTFRFGYCSFNALSWSKLPSSGWPGVEACPVTDWEASHGFW